MDVLTRPPVAAMPVCEQAVTLSVVVPVFNEHKVLLDFHHRLSDVLLETGVSHEVVYVDDGSTDRTARVALRCI